MNAHDVLPEGMRARSLSDREIVLSYDDALRVLDLLVDSSWALLGWEGWVRTRQGVGHHGDYQGAVSIDRKRGEEWNAYVQRGAEFGCVTIKQAQQRWEEDPKSADKELFFCLTAIGP